MWTYGKLTTIVLTALLIGSAAQAGTPIAGFSDTPVAQSLSAPTAIAFLPDGRLLVTEQGGALKLADNGSTSTLVNIPVCSDSEMGLLGVAVDPDFTNNGFIYLYRTKAGAGGCNTSTGRFNQVVRVTMAGGAIDIGSLAELVTGIRTDGGNHDGGVLRIGPDNKLYVGVGDTGLGDNVGGPGSSSNPYAQDLNELNGKILRVNLDGTIPTDNPFFGQAGKRAEIFAYGFRNPFRMGFDPLTGSLWVGDVGDLTIEEIDVVTAGKDYSWPYCEGNSPASCRHAGDVAPVLTYPHNGSGALGATVIGGAFAGASFGGLEHDYFFGDYSSSAIYHAVPNGTRDGFTGSPTTFVDDPGSPVDLVFGPDGALYYVAIAIGEVHRVAPSVAPPTDIDSYLCYKAALARGDAPFPKGTTIALSDELVPGPLDFSVTKAVTVCNPASVNGSTVNESSAHQEGFSIKRVKGSPKYARTNQATGDQFANRNLSLTQETTLLVPSSMALGNGGAGPYTLTTVDHYKCYRATLAKGSPKFVVPAPPTIVDQFFPGGQSFALTRPTKFCHPVAADGSAINAPSAHLVCYSARLPAGTHFTKTTVSTNNQFGADVLVASAVSELCVPAVTGP